MSVTTLENSPLSREKLLKIQETSNKWHEKRKEKVLRDVLFLRSMQTSLEKNASYIDDIATNALSLLQQIKEDGNAS